ncbi:DNA polymerase family A-domain-containing protein [Vararia minispora EC-137]|uniref:DNA polymerase family A-domain-containing protein n=1 Tax=Vararia minispora EC-137 TaxID=1314806 RepID=A0ACB8Q8E1_9AGAM|nr:DNA polymerase family A-domain-containing protein [Vararia minispora EC-137]
MFTYAPSTNRLLCRARTFRSSASQAALAQVQRSTDTSHLAHAASVTKPAAQKLAHYPRTQQDPPAAAYSAPTHRCNTIECLIHSIRIGKRNEVGVQLLSRQLHSQIFKNVSFPAPDARYVRIARDHLAMHGLDRSQGSVLPDIGFTLPPIQGETIDEHFHRIGVHAAEPWLSMAKDLVPAELPPQPEQYDVRSGWTKYHYHADGSSYSEPVPYPQHDGKPEEMVVFDVETLPEYGPYAIMAIAGTPNGWYAWISPWLLGETEELQQLVPLGPSDVSRIVVGHNVSYDRARIQEEYDLKGTQTRFLDTMALHVAVKGISSHQRPAWAKYRKSKLMERERQEEAYEAVVGLLRDIDSSDGALGIEPAQRKRLLQLRGALEESLLQSLDSDAIVDEDERGAAAATRWEDITSANGLADVAKLHCGIDVDKSTRDDFMTRSREEIREGVQDYLAYCADDVRVTHAVYAQVLPQFLAACPSPVSFAGMLSMGSAFLTVNENWERYIESAELTYRAFEDSVKARLVELAEEAKGLMESEAWREDVWLSQLDWTPKVAGKTRGISHLELSALTSSAVREPAWYKKLVATEPFSPTMLNRTLPLILRMAFDGKPLTYSTNHGWHFITDDGRIGRLPTASTSKLLAILGPSHGVPHIKSGALSSSDADLALAIASGERSGELWDRVLAAARNVLDTEESARTEDPWLQQLDWKMFNVSSVPGTSRLKKTKTAKPSSPPKPPPVYWPKWYWDLTKPKKGHPPGTVDLTSRSRLSPLLLRLSWKNWPMFHSRQYGWTFRVDKDAEYNTRQEPLEFYDPADESLQNMALHDGYRFHKLPHKDGDSANVGNPLSKTFVKYAQDGTMTSPGDEAKNALDVNAQCSYWISARDRVLNQTVVWQKEDTQLGLPAVPEAVPGDRVKKWGVILPQVITMGTVTRRAIERTWLTASNAKKNRVGSELKAMVRAPDGYAIVGADVDSEELWISSVMGDAQFGLHGATALGWMTLEGTKSAGTDLHSKTASILGISRDQAKVFNYSRIYGAGMRHAVLLLLQGNPGMLPEEAQKLAENLYASTKGKNTHRTDIFGRKFWFGGSESFVFNKLEEIALSNRPQTPALGCGVTYALSKEYLPAEFGSDYMPSRINWVVQSSGVDYLHLLIVAMHHLTMKYNIRARYLISVHDELRYLVAVEDQYRAALALQIANLWTRSLFAYRLGMDDLPQGVAFFSAVDVDHVLRKETDMSCVTPSQPDPIPPGESLDIQKTLNLTHGGSLWADGRRMDEEPESALLPAPGYSPPDCLQHRTDNAAFLQAQATSDFSEVKFWAQQVSGKIYEGGIGGEKKRKKRSGAGKGAGAKDLSKKPGAMSSKDWADIVQEILNSTGSVIPDEPSARE